VAARLPNSARATLFLVPRFIELETSLERKFRDGMIFEKGTSCNNISFENASSSRADIIFGSPGGDGAVAYLIGDEDTTAHAVRHYLQVNSLLLSMENIGRSLAGYCKSMETFSAEKAAYLTKSKSDNRFILQSLLQQKSYAEGSLAFGAHVSSLLDEARHHPDTQSVPFEFLSLVLRCWSAHYCSKVCRLSDAQHHQCTVKEDITDMEKNHLSLDFLKRLNDGGLAYLQEEIRSTVELARSERHRDILGGYATDVEAALERHSDTTQSYISLILENAEGHDGEPTVINSHEYVMFTGHVCVAWMWLKQGIQAHSSLTHPDTPESEKHFYLGKISALDYYCNYELVKTLSQSHMLNKNPQILDFAETDWLWFSPGDE
jgi:alkylation response protein AidB-like acyl-CoA dehydrogenase